MIMIRRNHARSSESSSSSSLLSLSPLAVPLGGGGGGSSGSKRNDDDTLHQQTQRQRKQQRQQRRRRRHNNNKHKHKGISFLVVTRKCSPLLVVVVVVVVVLLLLLLAVVAGLHAIGLAVFRRQPRGTAWRMDPRVQVHMDHYHQMRQIALTKTNSPRQNQPPQPQQKQQEQRPANVLLADYTFVQRHDNNDNPNNNNNNNNNKACQLTVVFLDPRLADPHYGVGESAWFALESAAAFLPMEETCMALLTTCCCHHSTNHNNNDHDHDTDNDTAIRDKVYASALPLLRQWMHAGRVRLTTSLNTTKYHLQACDNYGNPTPALVNADFWRHEFVSSDAEAVLVVQDDAVLCRTLHLSDWQPYALVGAVWPRVVTDLAPHPPQGMCWDMPRLWQLMHLRAAKKASLSLSLSSSSSSLLLSSFLDPCTQGRAPVGNGGLSWRNRTALIQAITTCPHVTWSGLPNHVMDQSDCRALDKNMNEDYYFATVLRGMSSASSSSSLLLPSARQASLFAVESLFPEQVQDMYGTTTTTTNDDDDNHNHDSYNSPPRPPPPIITVGDESFTVPLGFHKPWWYHSNEILLSKDMQQACPYLPFIFSPEMSRWKPHKEKQL